MNTTYISFTLFFLAGVLVCSLFKFNSVPRVKTRYFVQLGALRRWTFGQTKTELFSASGVWVRSSSQLKSFITDSQEIGALEAARMFPKAFKKSCGHNDCPVEYCRVQSDAQQYRKMSDIVNLVGSQHTTWKDTSRLHEQANFQFHGAELVLLPDGTYFLNDTSGA